MAHFVNSHVAHFFSTSSSKHVVRAKTVECVLMQLGRRHATIEPKCFMEHTSAGLNATNETKAVRPLDYVELTKAVKPLNDLRIKRMGRWWHERGCTAKRVAR